MPRAVLAAIVSSAVLASCGGSSEPQPSSQPSFKLGRSPDAGISEGHAVADRRAQRCRALHPADSRAWDRCNRNAR
jgi:hypothetical protein